MKRFFSCIISGLLLLSIPAAFAVGESASLSASTTEMTIVDTAAQGQSQVVNNVFKTGLQVKVTDHAGHGLSRVPVLFTAPASGASGTFLANGNRVLTVVTDDKGVASTRFVANGIVGGPYAVTASATGVQNPVHFRLSNTVDQASTLTATDTDFLKQQTAVNTQFSHLLRVTLTDMYGNPVRGAVHFSVNCNSHGACGTFANNASHVDAMTDAQGIAALVLTANQKIGDFSVTASVPGILTPVTFHLTNQVGSHLTLVGKATTQQVGVGKSFGAPLGVRVTDNYGNPAAGVAVNWVAPVSGSSVVFANGKHAITVNSDAQGWVFAPVTANATVGAYTVAASVIGISPVSFALANTSGLTPLSSIEDTTQAQTVNQAFLHPFRVTVKDAKGGVVSNASVTFTAHCETNQACGVFSTGANSATVVTDGNGIATAPVVTANTVAGSYEIVASNDTNSVVFEVSNTAGVPATLALGQQAVQSDSAIVAESFPRDMGVVVRDGFGNAVANTVVSFTANCVDGKACASFTNGKGIITAITAEDGSAQVGVTANTIAGAYNVTTSAATLTPLVFHLENKAGSADSVDIQGGDQQHAIVGTAFAKPLSVFLKDAYGNPVADKTIVFGSQCGRFAQGDTTAVTDSHGVATANTLTANLHNPGPCVVTAQDEDKQLAVNFSLTTVNGTPVIAIVSGNPQSTQVTTTFSALTVKVTDQSSGDPIPDAVVTFTAPSSGASATFGSTGSNIYYVKTDSNGDASSLIPAANTTAGAYVVTAGTPGAAGVVSFALTNTPDAVATLNITSGVPQYQSQTVGQAFGTQLSVTLVDSVGNPIAGQTVTFTAPSSGASGVFGSGTYTVPVTTNASGIAQAPVFTANSHAGENYAVTASVIGVTPQTFYLTNNAGAAATVSIQQGDSQSQPITAPPQTPFSTELEVLVTDSYGNAVPNAKVTFAAPSISTAATGYFETNGNNTINRWTDSVGIATTPFFYPNTVSGTYAVTATVSGIATPATFTLTNTAGTTVADLIITTGTPQRQNATVGAAFASALSVTATDSYGNPVSSSVNIVFTGPGSGAKPVFSNSSNTITVTTSAGIAAPTVTAGTVAGSYFVTATNSGFSQSFGLTNNAGTATQTVSQGGPTSVVVGQAAASSFSAEVEDAHGNPVSGASVLFTAPSSGPTGTFAGSGATATVTTGSNGIAISPIFTANTTAGAYIVTAKSAGPTLSFPTTTNVAATPSSITVSSGGTQSTTINTAFSALVALVADQYGNPVSGQTVTFTASCTSSQACIVTSPVTATTGSDGKAQVTPTANGIAGGSYAVKASVSGVATTADFNLTNNAGAPASMTIQNSSGTQTTALGTLFPKNLQVLITDGASGAGNPLPNIAVTFTAPSSGASGTFSNSSYTITAVTNGSGVASVPITANAQPGTFTVSAATGSLTQSFSLTNSNASVWISPSLVISPSNGMDPGDEGGSFGQITLINNSSVTLSGVSVAITGVSSADLTVENNGCVSAVAPGASCAISFSSAFNANEVVDDYDNNKITVTLTSSTSQFPASIVPISDLNMRVMTPPYQTEVGVDMLLVAGCNTPEVIEIVNNSTDNTAASITVTSSLTGLVSSSTNYCSTLTLSDRQACMVAVSPGTLQAGQTGTITVNYTGSNSQAVTLHVKVVAQTTTGLPAPNTIGIVPGTVVFYSTDTHNTCNFVKMAANAPPVGDAEWVVPGSDPDYSQTVVPYPSGGGVGAEDINNGALNTVSIVAASGGASRDYDNTGNSQANDCNSTYPFPDNSPNIWYLPAICELADSTSFSGTCTNTQSIADLIEAGDRLFGPQNSAWSSTEASATTAYPLFWTGGSAPYTITTPVTAALKNSQSPVICATTRVFDPTA